MKTLIALFLTVGFSQTVIAESLSGCDEVDKIARMIMTVRQDGAQMKDVVSAISNQFANSPELEGLIALTIKAYERPSYSATANKNNAVDEFANDIYLICLKGL